MLKGSLKNCYGIKELDLIPINFDSCNKSIIYASNGAMKTSFTKVFEDIANGKETSDRIFKGCKTEYEIEYQNKKYIFPTENGEKIKACKNFYVINSFSDKFEFSKETVSTLLADEESRKEYDVLLAQVKGLLDEIEGELVKLTGLSKSDVKIKLLNDLSLDANADWSDILSALKSIKNEKIDFLNEIKYKDLFNEKTEIVYNDTNFITHIDDYIEILDDLLKKSSVLNEKFNDQHAEALNKSLESNNLFEANHKIVLKDGTEICNLNSWKKLVDEQLKKIYEAPMLARIFGELKKKLSKNAETIKVRRIIINYRDIIPLLKNPIALKNQIWLNCFLRLPKPFDEYFNAITKHSIKVKELYKKAERQSVRWQKAIEEFNLRFKVPFKAIIKNKSNFILKDEAPNIDFEYSRVMESDNESVELETNEIKKYLSIGELRALYLLYIIFDLDKIRLDAKNNNSKYLIIADDIADSFDYKNKYAIIEYLNDISKTPNIDLLILTHNFDFFRTITSRLNFQRNNCFVAQRDDHGCIKMSIFRYQKDFFKNVIIKTLCHNTSNVSVKIKCLIASIPFYRNLADYCGNDDDYSKFTSFLHYKSDTWQYKISDLIDLLSPYIKKQLQLDSNENYFERVISLVKNDVLNNDDDVSLEDKLVLAIATRLLAEKFLKDVMINNGINCQDANKNQTSEWFNAAKPYLNDSETEIIEEVNLITPENIHLNAFMYEPLIDVSIWKLKDLFNKVYNLQNLGI